MDEKIVIIVGVCWVVFCFAFCVALWQHLSSIDKGVCRMVGILNAIKNSSAEVQNATAELGKKARKLSDDVKSQRIPFNDAKSQFFALRKQYASWGEPMSAEMSAVASYLQSQDRSTNPKR